MIFPDFAVFGTSQYPETLQRGDKADDVFTRCESTLRKYRERFLNFTRRAHIANHADEPLSLETIIYYVLRISPELSRSTRTQYRSACMQAIRDHIDMEQISFGEAEAMVELLDTLARQKESGEGIVPRTSARRAKWICTDEIEAIHKALDPRSPIDRALQVVALYGERLGMRPGEWLRCKLVGTGLEVKCGKYDPEGTRGVAATRTLSLAESFTHAERADLQSGLDAMFRLVRHYGDEATVLKCMQDRFRKVADMVAPGRKLVLRTFRDQCRSNLIACGVPRNTIAAILGHSSADSQFAYGETRQGRNRVNPVQVSPELVALVWDGASTLAKRRRRLEQADCLDVVTTGSTAIS